MGIQIRPVAGSDRDWVRQFIIRQWGDEIVVAHGAVYRPDGLPGFAAFINDRAAGLITYHLNGQDCEIVTLDSLHEGRGIGSALLEAVRKAAIRAGCRRLWLLTTNDNLHALGFYQKRGFRLAAVRPGAIDEARKLKPAIPLIGSDGIPIRDEIELEISPLEPAAEGNEAL